MNITITDAPNIGYNLYDPSACLPIRALGYVADSCCNSRIFSLLTLGHLHTLVHELGHAVAYRIITGGDATIQLSTKSCYGSTLFHPGPRQSSSWGITWIALSGPLADAIFSTLLIFGALAVQHSLALGLPAVFWMRGELLYAILSAWKEDQGDFGQIASEGWPHLLVASALLVSICALGIFKLHYGL